VRNGSTDIVKFLLEAGADPNNPDEVTATLLFVHFYVLGCNLASSILDDWVVV
jgi:hypothetical protein